MVHTSKLYGRAEFDVPGERGIITCFGGDLTDQEIHNHLKIRPGRSGRSARYGHRGNKYGLVRYRLPGKGRGQITCIGKGRTKKEIHSFLHVHHPRVRKRLTRRHRRKRHHSNHRRKFRRPRRPVVRIVRSPLQKTMKRMSRPTTLFAKKQAAKQAVSLLALEKKATNKLGATPRATVAHITRKPTAIQTAVRKQASKDIDARALEAARDASAMIDKATEAAAAEVKEHQEGAFRDVGEQARTATRRVLGDIEGVVGELEKEAVSVIENAATTVVGAAEAVGTGLRDATTRVSRFFTGSSAPTAPVTAGPTAATPTAGATTGGGYYKRRTRRRTKRKRKYKYRKRRSRR